MSDKTKTKKNQNKNENNPKYKPKPFKEQAKEARIPQSKPKIEKTQPTASKNIKSELDNLNAKTTHVEEGHQFSDQKRETDDVLKISEKPNSKYAKREIKSNWPEFEMPPQHDDDDEEVSQGADFEALLQIPMSVGGHFQFKHEKTWVQRKNSTGYTDLFGLDAGLISDAISCIPFFERNSLDPSLFSQEQLSRMINTAKKNQTNFDKNLATASDKNDIAIKSLKKRYTTGEIEKNIKPNKAPQFNSLKELSDELPVRAVSNVTNKDVISKKLEKVVINDDDDELEMLLETVMQPVNNVKLPSMSSGNEAISIPIVAAVQSSKVNTPPEVDLDKWLDDYLES